MRPHKHPKVSDIEFTDLMHALSDPARVDIVRKLDASKSQVLTCGELLGNRPKSSMSHHFKILRDSGIILTTIYGKEHQNRLRTAELDQRFPGLMKALLKALRSEA